MKVQSQGPSYETVRATADPSQDLSYEPERASSGQSLHYCHYRHSCYHPRFVFPAIRECEATPSPIYCFRETKVT